MMSIFKRFKGEQVAALPEVLNATMGRSIEIEQMTIKLLPEDSLLDLESTTLSIVAQVTAILEKVPTFIDFTLMTTVH